MMSGKEAVDLATYECKVKAECPEIIEPPAVYRDMDDYVKPINGTIVMKSTNALMNNPEFDFEKIAEFPVNSFKDVKLRRKTIEGLYITNYMLDKVKFEFQPYPVNIDNDGGIFKLVGKVINGENEGRDQQCPHVINYIGALGNLYKSQ
ncbi:hypothetical protein CANARDRAFT_30757 [[Candida] arabinofermentans NRRL YB-2248]|uniref:Uncharacterized protein n=1 Tax=[Candida] arabinofermentans NRRL YB-2248 TaxID=983967 RepID=A0A1E4SSP9_9ASCO|nr:hypothetical protein CANARDRAFT_30757 [[Candida] arabinofermentans NRRL YB-2248]